MTSIPTAQGFWVNPNHNRTDYENAFATPSQWPITLSKASVLNLSSGAIGNMTAAQIQTAMSFIKANNLKFALTFQLVPGYLTGCGSGVSSTLGNQAQLDVLCQKIQTANGVIDIIDMDETLFWGHYSTKTNACQFPISTLITETHTNLARIRGYFPSALVQSTESVNQVGPDPAGFAQWISGVKPDLFSFDVQWGLANVYTYINNNMLPVLNSNNVKYGVILDGYGPGAGAVDNATYVAAAQSNAQKFAASVPQQPDHVVFADWQTYTDHLLPETDNTAAFHIPYWWLQQGGLVQASPPAPSPAPAHAAEGLRAKIVVR